MKTSGQRPAHIDTTQRAVPDLSAYDDEIAIVKSGEDTTLAGTSAAAPMVAGMLASINDALLAAGHKTTLGFVNPLLYANEVNFATFETDLVADCYYLLPLTDLSLSCC